MKNYAQKVVRLLTDKHLRLATAESCTGGLISALITDISGASAVFDCGVVSYSNSIKSSLLDVSEETLLKYGAVSEETVKEMVSGVVRISGADVAVAVSGIAGPDSDNTKKPVGLIWLAVFYDGKITAKQLNNSFRENIREQNRISAATEALKLICSVIDN